jgi:outer membrane protein OmpA-like peptidoglycan-associated protein
MRSFIRALVWFLLLAFVSLLLNYWLGDKLCGVCTPDTATQTEKQPVKVENEPVPALKDFVISTTDGSAVLSFPDRFVIRGVDGQVEIPEALSGWKDSIYNFLNKHQDRELLISAKYLSEEGEPRGMERASFLKDLLVQAQVNPGRIIPQAVLAEYSYDASGKYPDGIAMVFRQLSEEHKKEVEKSIANKILYTEFATAEFNPDRTLQAYVYELKAYLSEHPDKTVNVTGHTDSKGSAASNYNLGLKRAGAVVNYLVSQGLDKTKFKVLSKGETQPVATNDTEEGRAMNRRIEIEVK